VGPIRRGIKVAVAWLEASAGGAALSDDDTLRQFEFVIVQEALTALAAAHAHLQVVRRRLEQLDRPEVMEILPQLRRAEAVIATRAECIRRLQDTVLGDPNVPAAQMDDQDVE
jgi:hypothetical protein